MSYPKAASEIQWVTHLHLKFSAAHPLTITHRLHRNPQVEWYFRYFLWEAKLKAWLSVPSKTSCLTRATGPFLSEELLSPRLYAPLSPPWSYAGLSILVGRVNSRINVCGLCIGMRKGSEMGCSTSEHRKELLRNLQIPPFMQGVNEV